MISAVLDHYDRDGNPISLDRWIELFHDKSYQQIAASTIGDVFVSTVWMGIDHGHGYSDWPIIFETMLFGPDGEGGECYRYCTKEDARAGHEEIVEQLSLVKAAVE